MSRILDVESAYERKDDFYRAHSTTAQQLVEDKLEESRQLELEVMKWLAAGNKITIIPRGKSAIVDDTAVQKMIAQRKDKEAKLKAIKVIGVDSEKT